MPDLGRTCDQFPSLPTATHTRGSHTMHPLYHALGAGVWQPCLAVLAATAVAKEFASLWPFNLILVQSPHISKFPN